MSPNFGPKDSRSAFLTWPWGKELAYALIGPERSWQPDNEQHAQYWTYQYPTEAILPMMGLVNIVNEIDLSALSTPALWVYAENDQVLNVPAIETAFERYGANQKEAVVVNHSQDRSQHVLAGDILSPNTTDEITQQIVQFFQF
jgi:esterase/lipase